MFPRGPAIARPSAWASCSAATGRPRPAACRTRTAAASCRTNDFARVESFSPCQALHRCDLAPTASTASIMRHHQLAVHQREHPPQARGHISPSPPSGKLIRSASISVVAGSSLAGCLAVDIECHIDRIRPGSLAHRPARLAGRLPFLRDRRRRAPPPSPRGRQRRFLKRRGTPLPPASSWMGGPLPPDSDEGSIIPRWPGVSIPATPRPGACPARPSPISHFRTGSPVSFFTCTSTLLNAGVRDCGSARRGISTFDSG